MSIRKGDNVIAGASVGFIGKPAWSQAVNIPVAGLVAGYTAPSDGLIVGYIHTTNASTLKTINVNNVAVAVTYGTSSDISIGQFQVQVNKGDTVTLPTITVNSASINFVPFEYSGVSDINIITPEYIRNMNTPDYAHQKTISSNTWTADEDVWITYTTLGTPSATTASLTVDGVTVSVTDGYTDGRTYSFNGRVSKGSVVSCRFLTSPNICRVFPFKAQ